MKKSTLALTTLGIALSTGAWAQTASLKAMESGVFEKAGYYMPQRIALSKDKPAEIKKEPAYTNTPMYGTMTFAGAKYVVVVDEAADNSASLLYIDANGDGDLTNDAAVTWKRNARKTVNPQTKQEGEDVVYTGSNALAAKGKNYGLSFYRLLSRGDELKGSLLYYRDYGQTGEIKLGKKTYPVVLLDETATGTYLTDAERKSALLIDRDGNGKFDSQFERFDLSKPFNIAGNVYEVDKIAADGSEISLKKSAKTAKEVAEIPIPADLGVGKKALVFTRPVIGGKTVNFPKDFKGKVVMLDFWATWCGPCIGELPGLTKAYAKYHPKGFEILGISLDQPNQLEKVQAFLKDKNMPWAQVYDGKFWQAEVAQMYSVNSIPRAFLVNGSTGEIIATTEKLRGEELEKTLERALSTGSAAEKDKGSK